MTTDKEDLPRVSQVVHSEEGGSITNVVQKANTYVLDSPNDLDFLRARSGMLETTQKNWIEEVFQVSIEDLGWIELNLKYQPEAVEHPHNMPGIQQNQQQRTLEPGTTIDQVFDPSGGLLILGEPGSGKTTALLSLARTLVEDAWEDPTQPVPLVLHLSFWQGEGTDFLSWSITQLSEHYYLSQDIAREWLEKGRVALLLDGLNEVKAEYRNDCVRAINNFRQVYASTPLAVCCRAADYQRLPVRLRLRDAVYLASLSHHQVLQALERAGPGLQDIDGLLKKDPILLGLSQTPLMLRILVSTYRAKAMPKFSATETAANRRKELFAAYIQEMFDRRRPQAFYPADVTSHVLRWLARAMSSHNQSIFYVESLRPDWLPSRSHRIAYFISIRLIVAILVGLLDAFLYNHFGGSEIALQVGLITGSGVLFASLLALRMQWLPAILLTTIWTAGLSSLLLGPVGGLFFGLLLGLQTGVAGVAIEQATVTEKRVWSWKKANPVILFVTSIAFLTIWASLIKTPLAAFGAIVLPFLIHLPLVLGWKTDQKFVPPVVPNQGFWRAARNTGIAAAISIFINVLNIALLAAVTLVGAKTSPDSTVDLLGIIQVSVALVLINLLPVTLALGGAACIRHLMLRAILSITTPVPWKIVQYLDEAAESSILQKVGGGYLFLHRLLLEYFLETPL